MPSKKALFAFPIAEIPGEVQVKGQPDRKGPPVDASLTFTRAFWQIETTISRRGLGSPPRAWGMQIEATLNGQLWRSKNANCSFYLREGGFRPVSGPDCRAGTDGQVGLVKESVLPAPDPVRRAFQRTAR